MNRNNILYELEEAQCHLEELLNKIKYRKLEDNDGHSLAIMIAHIIGHFAFAWNTRNMSSEEVDNLSQDEFEKLSNTIPDPNVEFILENGEASETGSVRNGTD